MTVFKHHLTPEFIHWFSKPAVTVPTSGVSFRFSVVCWFVAFRSKYRSIDDSLESFTKYYLKFSKIGKLNDEEITTFKSLGEYYHNASLVDLGLDDLKNVKPVFQTDPASSGDYEREFLNVWTGQTEDEVITLR